VSASLFSTSWYRVASLRPRLRSQAKVHRHVYRNQVWYVVQDLASGKFLRFNENAYTLIALLDGFRSVDEIWQHGITMQGDDAPTQDEVISLLAQLHQSNLLRTNEQPDLAELESRRDKAWQMKLKQYVGNPLSLRLPLIDPDRFLTWLVGGMPQWRRNLWLLLWLLLVSVGFFGLVMHWHPLTEDLASRAFTAEYVLLLFIVFPLLKAMHELGHGIAIKLYGGQCHEMGVMLLVLMPIPYVDASASTGFTNKWQRVKVAAAGMMIELAIAALALWLWTWVQPGVFKSFLHEMVIIAGVSTILFNINPLLRLDGYYIFADTIEIPNLGQKANQYLGYLLKRYMLKVRQALPPASMVAGEGGWLLSYSLLSFAYRMFITGVILLFVAEQYFFLGVVLAVWASYLMLLAPLLKQIKQFWSDPELLDKRVKAFSVLMTLISVLGYGLFVIPAPMSTVTQGIVWLPEHAQVRAATDCFGGSVVTQSLSLVKAGDLLLTCGDIELDARVSEYTALVQEQEARLLMSMSSDRINALMVKDDLLHAQKSLANALERKKSAEIFSATEGKFIMPAVEDFEGKFWSRGQLIAYVLDPATFSILAVVPQSQADWVRKGTQSVEVRFVENVFSGLPATMIREVPAATKSLPSLALALQGGGDIALDPASSDQENPQALDPMFQFELSVDKNQMPTGLGSRVYVRFNHEPLPLALQWYFVLRELFMKRFEI
jgi:putative peptide zinc metalloprotease protein